MRFFMFFMFLFFSAIISFAEPSEAIAEKIKSMTLDEKIGQMFIVELEGTEIDKASLDFIQKYKLGGIILFGTNISSEGQIKNFLSDINEINNSVSKNKLFIGIDEEGGRISRLSKIYDKLPPNYDIGTKNSSLLAFEKGSILGEELYALGINTNFAPVLDIFSNPENKVIGDRAFSNNEKIVSELGVSMISGINSQDVIAVGKHFPGHGDTKVDSHFGLPEVMKTEKELMDFEIVPFKSAIDYGIDMIMISHILYPKIDDKYPASLSPAIINGILRDKLKYNGIVISDDLDMGAIRKNFAIDKSAVQAVKAGNDIILVCHDYNKVITAITSLKKAVQSGEISESRINESLVRILTLKDKYLNKVIEKQLLSSDEIKEKVLKYNEKLKTAP